MKHLIILFLVCASVAGATCTTNAASAVDPVICGTFGSTPSGGAVGGASSLLTAGYMPYVTSAGLLGANTTFGPFWDNANNEMRVGPTAATYGAFGGGTGVLHARGDSGTAAKIRISSAGAINWLAMDRTNGSVASPTALLSDDIIGNIVGVGNYGNAAAYVHGPQIEMRATENWDVTHNGNGIKLYTIYNTTTSQIPSLSLNDDGLGAVVFANTRIKLGNAWQINSDGRMLTLADNTYDIGGSGATFRPRNIWAGTLMQAPTIAAGPGNTSPTGTLYVYDATATTGVTTQTIRAGAASGSGNNILNVTANDGTTSWFRIRGNGTIFALDLSSSTEESNFSNTGLRMGAAPILSWNSGGAYFNGSTDTAIRRTSAGLLSIDNGTANGAARVKWAPTVVGALGTCDATAEGTRWGVTDALTPVALSTVSAGGSVHVPVYCDGTNWIVL